MATHHNPSRPSPYDVAGVETTARMYACTSVAIVAARALGLPTANVTVHMGDSDLPPIMIAGGSNNAASASLVVAKACEPLRDKIARAALEDSGSAFHGMDPASLLVHDLKLSGAGHEQSLRTASERAGHRLEVYAENVPEGLPSSAMADERVNVLGIKGIGEIGIVGMNATGYRIRSLPIRLEKLL